ncbi:DUF3021 domain-containing protein [Streptococcus loxodontisalivarius]|uniref:DUF3021 domain-containing protein n=1 Tax=Streptococcus loxodontisalivarius TaxID=1349415 RepID=A0ABS2PTF8_9STRE|nr:DUF3021 domain-containing protein [Streptococcus loxodontisalivarius]MBM7642840.1 hypothetical protein [Streptococcus loxodontisalivarius]
MKVLKSYIIGVGIGQIFYISSLMLFGISSQSLSNIASTAFLSGFMGVASLIYGVKGLSPLSRSLLHFVMILSLATGMVIYNKWLPLDYFLGFAFEFTVIYLLIWTLTYLLERRKINRINQTLLKTRNKS